ncbi:MAG: hypothetical protein V1816_00520 [Pseudomonadota bacterium]
MIELLALLKEFLKMGILGGQKHALGGEIPGGQVTQIVGTTGSVSQSNITGGPIPQENFRIIGLKTGLERLVRAFSLPQPGQSEFDVFTRAQGVDGKIGTGTEIVSGSLSPYGNLISSARFRICNDEFRKKRLFTQIFHGKILNHTIFLAKGNLPFLQGHAFRLSVSRSLFSGTVFYMVRFFGSAAGFFRRHDLFPHAYLFSFFNIEFSTSKISWSHGIPVNIQAVSKNRFGHIGEDIHIIVWSVVASGN